MKESFTPKNRANFVTLQECIVSEIQLDGKKYFFAVLYRSPSQTAANNPYAMIFTSDFKCRSPQWWENDSENEEGKMSEPHTSEFGLHLLISEGTHMMGNSKSCKDLIFTDHPNLFLESGVLPSVHKQCHYQVVYCELGINHLAPPQTLVL